MKARRGLVAFVVGLAVLVAGCGGGSGLTVASMPGVSAKGRHRVSSRFGRGGGVGFVGGPSPAQQAAADVTQLRFSRCMRAHGVPNFPDPSATSFGYGALFASGGGLDPAAPLFRVAQRSCQAVFTQRAVFVQ